MIKRIAMEMAFNYIDSEQQSSFTFPIGVGNEFVIALVSPGVMCVTFAYIITLRVYVNSVKLSAK